MCLYCSSWSSTEETFFHPCSSTSRRRSSNFSTLREGFSDKSPLVGKALSLCYLNRALPFLVRFLALLIYSFLRIVLEKQTIHCPRADHCLLARQAPAKAVHDWEDAKALLLAYESCIAVYLYAKAVKRLYRKSGGLFLALYLKQCASSLQIAYGGDRRPHDRLPVPVSLTRLLAKRMDFSTFASIVSPWKDLEKVVQAVNWVAEMLPQLVGRYLPWVSKIPLDEGVTWEPTWKAIPNSPYLSQQLRFPTIESEL
ncbi:hypothetical protein Lal_00024712 [Lupinus albus]|nr:hypothetical protein Lal_00024712 [Lupinus albus]